MPAYFADRRLYLDKAGKVVEEGDSTKQTLLVGVGGMIPEEQARALGLIKAKQEAPENKVKKSVLENKAKE